MHNQFVTMLSYICMIFYVHIAIYIGGNNFCLFSSILFACNVDLINIYTLILKR